MTDRITAETRDLQYARALQTLESLQQQLEVMKIDMRSWWGLLGQVQHNLTQLRGSERSVAQPSVPMVSPQIPGRAS